METVNSKEKKVIENSYLIKDPLLHPFYIRVEENQFTLLKDIGKGYKDPPISFHSSFRGVIAAIIHSKTFGKKRVVDLQEYYKMYITTLKEIYSKFDPKCL